MFYAHLLPTLTGFGVLIASFLAPSQPVPLWEMPRDYTVADCDYFCDTNQCDDGEHRIIVSADNNATAAHLEYCQLGGCGGHACSGGDSGDDDNDIVIGASLIPLGEIWWQVRHGEIRNVREVLRKYARVAFYNPDWRAIQVKDCQGLVIASLPVSASQVALLGDY